MIDMPSLALLEVWCEGSRLCLMVKSTYDKRSINDIFLILCSNVFLKVEINCTWSDLDKKF